MKIVQLCIMVVTIITITIQAQQSYNTTNHPIYVTIWVHGSLIGPNFILHDFFYRKLGMIPATAYDPKYQSRNIALSLCNADPNIYQLEHFYFWGWSGKLSRRARASEARVLYRDTVSLLKEYRKKFPHAPIYLRMISHSHGGNVLLNLSAAYDPGNPLIFDELILLSCPVQYATKENITADCFKKIYSFYSSDLYQVIDFQYTQKNGKRIKVHSDRRFKEISNLRQTKIKINGRAILHIEFMLDKFLKHVPLLCTELDTFYAELSAKQSLREKLIHIHSCRRQTSIRKKLL